MRIHAVRLGVFALEALLLVFALVLSARVRVSESRVVGEERQLFDHDASAGAAALT
jgi:hypothetical protein